MKLNESIKRSMKQKLLKEASEITIEDVKRWLTSIADITETFDFAVIDIPDVDKLAEEFMKTGYAKLAEGDGVAAHLVNNLKAIGTSFEKSSGPMIVFTTNWYVQQDEQLLGSSDEGKAGIDRCVKNFPEVLRCLDMVERSINDLNAVATV